MSLADYAIQFAGALIQSAPVALFLFFPLKKMNLKSAAEAVYHCRGRSWRLMR